MDEYVRDELDPMPSLGIHPSDVKNPRRNALVRTLQGQVK